MAKYKLVFKQSVAKDLRTIPNAQVAKIIARIDMLAENPRAAGCIKLSGSDKYRVRQGDHRIVYEIRDTELVVSVIRIAHRSSIYKSKT
jgi:mRNA interferase RelE/StbE